MKNKRIGKILGKTVLLDTPPYGDKKARTNEIIFNNTINSDNNDYINKLRICYIKEVVSDKTQLSFKTRSGATVTIYENGGPSPIKGLFGNYDKSICLYHEATNMSKITFVDFDYFLMHLKDFISYIIISPDERIPDEGKKIAPEDRLCIVETLGIGTFKIPR